MLSNDIDNAFARNVFESYLFIITNDKNLDNVSFMISRLSITLRETTLRNLPSDHYGNFISIPLKMNLTHGHL